MIKELDVLNGKLSLEFDSLNTKYTVNLNNMDDIELDIKYQVPEEVTVVIENNFLVLGENIVTLIASNGKEETKYLLYVYKEKIDDSVAAVPLALDIETDVTKEISPYAVPGISSICFLIILFLFVVLFHKKTINKKYNCKLDVKNSVKM